MAICMKYMEEFAERSIKSSCLKRAGSPGSRVATDHHFKEKKKKSKRSSRPRR
jgi:hypothetical protein